MREQRERLDSLVHQLALSRESLVEMRDYATASRELSQAYRLFSELYDFLPIPYLLLDMRGVIARANETAARLFGLPRAALVGRPVITLFSRDSVRQITSEIFRPGTATTGVNRSFEARVLTAEASPLVRLVWRRAEDDEGETTFHVAVIDLTEARHLQEQSRRAEVERGRSAEAERLAREASEAKDQFLATLSHELRTPLTPILSAVDSVKDAGVSPEVRAALDVIRRNVRAEARLIDDLLDVARITQRKLWVRRQRVDLHEILSNAADDWRSTLHAAQIEFALDLQATRSCVDGDAARLGQVCRNLLSNAVKFSDAGSRITISTRNTDTGISVTFVDTGIGMEPGQAEHVFEPFVQLAGDAGRRAGLGLGLVICRGIVDAHDGTIRATSDGNGRGTTVVFELPTPSLTPGSGADAPCTTAKTAMSEPARVSAPGAKTGPKRVLLLEDHADSAQMLALLLRSEGYDVALARSKREGLARLDGCDLVVSDIGLPDGTGLEFMAEARKHQRVTGIALSGFGSEQDVQRSLEAGFSEHLTKPVDFERLLDAVRRLT